MAAGEGRIQEIMEGLRDQGLLIKGETELLQERLKNGVKDPRVKIMFEDKVRQLERDAFVMKTLHYLMGLEASIPLKMYEAMLGKKSEKKEGE